MYIWYTYRERISLPGGILLKDDKSIDQNEGHSGRDQEEGLELDKVCSG
ncbi:hypothetical protein CEXT_727191, partial [Caerostris extrusa]